VAATSWDRRYQAAAAGAAHTGTVSKHGDLGAALHGWRDRVSPGDVGLPAGRARRAPGLRREELAMLAGVSTDYLSRVEQGRQAHVSDAVLDALAGRMEAAGPFAGFAVSLEPGHTVPATPTQVVASGQTAG